MKIIDKTPLLDAKGELGFTQRFQGMFQFGFNWPNELQAQKAIITFFDRQLEKGYTLIRNMPLGQSGIIVPMILLGPTGIHVIQIANMRGRYEIRGDTWNVASGEKYKPAPVNLVQQTMRMANAVRVFIERQGVKLPASPEAVLIAGDPGLHIESVRPAIKTMMIDGIRSFVSGLATGKHVLSPEQVFDFTERIINPRPPRKESAALSASITAPRAEWEQESSPQGQEVSRARAIFNASDEAKPFDPADFDFEMTDDEPSMEAATTGSQELSPARPLQEPAKRSNRIPGMTPVQFTIIASLALALLCILVAFGYIIF
ncbi:MAG: NERD domain-containing protein, partial [Anaerolineae bacterium]|nr:NERD domain-containing protein [Anaerolineae bacterium]